MNGGARWCWWRCAKSEEEYQIEKGRLMQEQRANVNSVYDKKKAQNELLRKVWEPQICINILQMPYLLFNMYHLM